MTPLEALTMTPEQADNVQKWQGMDGATAFEVIEREAESMQEAGAMMEAWRRAAVKPATQAFSMASHKRYFTWSMSQQTHPINHSEWGLEIWCAAEQETARRCEEICENAVWSTDIEWWRQATKREVSARSALECGKAIRAAFGEGK